MQDCSWGPLSPPVGCDAHTSPGMVWSPLGQLCCPRRVLFCMPTSSSRGTVSGQGRSCLIADCELVLTDPTWDIPGCWATGRNGQFLGRGPRITGDARAAWKDEGL